MSPDGLQSRFAKALARPAESIKPLNGGCSYPAYWVSSGRSEFFVKTNDEADKVFLAEAEGLQELAKHTTMVPELIYHDPYLLVLEFVKPETPTPQFWRNLGTELAQLHRDHSDVFGFDSDNFIGLSTQKNICSETTSWNTFFLENRLLFKINQLNPLQREFWTESKLSQLQKLCDLWLDSDEIQPSPLHGDLWNGNVLCGPNQKPYIFDPAFYYGHSETDLAMTECFGGFTQDFYKAYRDILPVSDKYEVRKHIYNLYHMLNHQVIFGESYKTTVLNIFNELLTHL